MENELSLRLAELRKKNNLSQEALAEKLSLSRQAISKWERGESAPDTENLIALSKIFGVTLDELVGKKSGENPVDISVDGEKNTGEFFGEVEQISQKNEQLPAVAEQQLSRRETRKEKRIERRNNRKEKISERKNSRVKKEKAPMLYPKTHSVLLKIPVIIIVPIAFVLIGIFTGVWHPTWLINIIIPIYYLLCHAFGARNRKQFFVRMPVLLLTGLIFLSLGFTIGWSKAWIVLLVNPVYYWLAFLIKK